MILLQTTLPPLSLSLFLVASMDRPLSTLLSLFALARSLPRTLFNKKKALSLFGDAAVCNFPADEQVEVEGVATDGTTVKVGMHDTFAVYQC